MEIVDSLAESIAKETGNMEKALQIVRRLTVDFGGEQIYIPQERFAFREVFEKEVYEDFDGQNYRELCKKYNVSKNTIRRIVKDERKRKIAEEKASQGYLF